MSHNGFPVDPTVWRAYAFREPPHIVAAREQNRWERQHATTRREIKCRWCGAAGIALALLFLAHFVHVFTRGY